MIFLFDSSRLNNGDLVYDDDPVGLVVAGYHPSVRIAGQPVARKREGMDMEILCGFT